jgi:hypothetical protein
MTSSERASIFTGEEEATFDLTGFKPVPPARGAPRPADIAAVSTTLGFRSREAAPQRRPLRTGRSVQFNLKASPETIELFRRISEAQGWSLAVTLERALDALDRELRAADS